MALSCQMTLNYGSYAAGQTPAPMATLFVFNPGATAVVVTGVQVNARVLGDPNINRTAFQPPMPAIGPGQTVSVPAGSSITIGPFPIVVASAANANSFYAQSSNGVVAPVNPQPSQPMQYVLLIGADVNGSDGSANVAGVAPLLVSYTSAPPLGFQGGYLQFASPNNFIGCTPGWP